MTDNPIIARTAYHPLVVTLHWVMALLVVGMLAAGFLVLGDDGVTPDKIIVMRAHMLGGVFTLILLVARAISRWRTSSPAPADSGLLGGVAWAVHRGFYLLLLVAVVSGIATARLSGLPEYIFGTEQIAGGLKFSAYPSFAVHKVVVLLLAATIALHVGAALYHQLVRRDRLLRRMWFGA